MTDLGGRCWTGSNPLKLILSTGSDRSVLTPPLGPSEADKGVGFAGDPRNVATTVPTPGPPGESAITIHALNATPNIIAIQSPPTHIHGMAALRAAKREVRVVKLPTSRLESLSESVLNVGKQIYGPHGMLAPGRDPS